MSDSAQTSESASPTKAEADKLASIENEQRAALRRESERTKLGVWLALGLFAAVVVYLVAAGDRGTDAQILQIAVPVDAKSLDPHNFNDIESGRVCQLIYDGLVAYSPRTDSLEHDPVPALAESWTLLDDNRTYRFQLREGVRFHDGAELSGEAVKMALDRARGADESTYGPGMTAPPYASVYADIVRIEVDENDPMAVIIELAEPNVAFLRNLAMSPAAIPSPAWMRAQAEGREHPISGSGPLKLRNWSREQAITLERFDEYWGAEQHGLLKVDRVVLQVVTHHEQRLNNLRSGAVHIAADIQPEHAGQLESASGLRLIRVNVPNVCYLVLNPNPQIPTVGDSSRMRPNPLAEVWLREAITLALDKGRIIDVVYRGFAEPAKGMLPPTILGHPGHFEHEPQSARLARARQLLAENGHGPDNPVPVTFHYFSDPRAYIPNTDALAQQVQIQLGEIGIDVRLEVEPWEQYRTRSIAGVYPFLLIGWQTVTGDPDYTFSPLFGVTADGSPTNLNMSKWVDAEFQSLVQQARREFDRDRREALYHRLEEIRRDAFVNIPLAHYTPIWGVSDKVQNFAVHPVGQLLLMDTTVGEPTPVPAAAADRE